MTYEEKMRTKWGAYYELMLFVQNETPENAVLLQDANWYYQTVDLYFLYPRQLIYGGEDVLRNNPQIDYVIISEDYPNFSVAGEKVMFDDRRGVYRIRSKP